MCYCNWYISWCRCRICSWSISCICLNDYKCIKNKNKAAVVNKFGDGLIRITFGNGVARNVAAVPRDVAAVAPAINDNVGFTTAHEPGHVYNINAQQNEDQISEKYSKNHIPRFTDNVAVIDELDDGKKAVIDDLHGVIDDLHHLDDGKDANIEDLNVIDDLNVVIEDLDLDHDGHLEDDLDLVRNGDLEFAVDHDPPVQFAATSTSLGGPITAPIDADVAMAATPLRQRSNGQLNRKVSKDCFLAEILKRLCDWQSHIQYVLYDLHTTTPHTHHIPLPNRR